MKAVGRISIHHNIRLAIAKEEEMKAVGRLLMLEKKGWMKLRKSLELNKFINFFQNFKGLKEAKFILAFWICLYSSSLKSINSGRLSFISTEQKEKKLRSIVRVPSFRVRDRVEQFPVRQSGCRVLLLPFEDRFILGDRRLAILKAPVEKANLF